MKDGQKLERVRFRDLVNANGVGASSDIRVTQGVEIVFEAGCVRVTFKGKDTFVPMGNVAYCWPLVAPAAPVEK